MKRAIEDSFPIVEINRLAVPERNSFKPIYQMHKWFARRASCVFRAILLGCLKLLPVDEHGKPTKSGAEVIMEEFYKDHTNDPDTNGKVILDPFMGGGTTVVEALRLGCKVIGIDLNPVAWFIVKTEVEPVDIDELKAAFDRLAARIVPWSGKPLKETLLDLYKTTCPCCGNKQADSIYTFWVKSAICTNPTCKKQVPLFKDYIVAHKQPSIKYWRDAECPECRKKFDWETMPASLVADAKLMLSAGSSAGNGRSNIRWAYSSGDKVKCPWCEKDVKPYTKAKQERKKVPLTVLLCPHCDAVWQWRGKLPEDVTCPVCSKGYKPMSGNVTEKGKFVCPHCGTKERIIESVRRLPEDERLPTRQYGLEGYCPMCAGKPEEVDTGKDLLGNGIKRLKKSKRHECCVTYGNGGKFFKRIDPQTLNATRGLVKRGKWRKTGYRIRSRIYPTDRKHTGYWNITTGIGIRCSHHVSY